MKTAKASAKAVGDLITGLEEEDLILLTSSDNRPQLLEFLRGLRQASDEATYVILLSDDEAPEALRQHVAPWRELATLHGYLGRIVWTSRKGYTLKAQGPKAGPCYKGWNHLQEWALKNDEPTADACGFWIPRILAESAGKNVKDQFALLADLRKRFAFPEHHLASFGSAALLSALIFAHYKRTGERVPLNRYWVRTDTLHANGNRLGLGNFSEQGLDCDDWDWDEIRYDNLGCFPLGVQILGT